MRRVKDRDAEAFNALYNRYAPRLLGTIRRFLRDPHESEDVLQNVFFYIWHHGTVFRPERGSVQGFLFQVMRSRLTDHFRRNARVPDVMDPLPDAPGEGLAEDDSVAGRLAAEAILNLLSPRERQVIELAVFGGFSQPEIAKLLRAPLGSVKSWSRRGLDKLRHKLSEQEGDSGHGPPHP